MEKLDVRQVYSKFNSLERLAVVEDMRLDQKIKLIQMWKAELKGAGDVCILKELSSIVQQRSLVRVDDENVAKAFEMSGEEVERMVNYISEGDCREVLIGIAYELEKKQKDHKLFEGQILFDKIIREFEHLQKEEVRQKAMELAMKLMIKNSQLIPRANQPYYLLEYFVFQINKNESEDKALQLFTYLRKINLAPHSEELFTENDYKAIIDVLVRHLQNCPEEKAISFWLQTYLILSVNPKSKKNGKYYKIELIFGVLSEIKQRTVELLELEKELKLLYEEKD